MENSKSIFKSRTIWGVLFTVAAPLATQGYQAWTETKSVEGVLSAVLPALVVAAVPAGVAVDGRIRANKSITFK